MNQEFSLNTLLYKYWITGEIKDGIIKKKIKLNSNTKIIVNI